MVQVAYTKSQPETFVRINKIVSVINGSPFTNTDIFTPVQCGRSLTGTRNPEFRRAVREGRDATTPLDATTVSHDLISPFQLSNYNSSGGTTCTAYATDFNGFDIDTTGFASIVESKARTKAYQEISPATRGYQILGELGETIRMIRQPAVGLRKGIDLYRKRAWDLRKGFFRKGDLERYRKAIAELWLEYSFGWAPLVGDIESIYGTFRDKIERPEFVPFRASVTDRAAIPDHLVGGAGSSLCTWNDYRSTSFEYGVYYQGTVKWALSSNSTFEKLGLFPTEFLPAAWELMPWSFLIDYFINIGSILDASAQASRVSYGYIVRGTRYVAISSNRREANSVSLGQFPVGSTIHVSSYTPGQIVSLSKIISRRSATDIPLPNLHIKRKLGSSKILNIAALIALKGQDIRWLRSG